MRSLTALGSAPAARSSSVTSASMRKTAKCSGVSPARLRTLGSAPYSSNRATVGANELSAAWCSGVSWVEFARLGSAPRSRRNCTTSWFSQRIECINGESPSCLGTYFRVLDVNIVRGGEGLHAGEVAALARKDEVLKVFEAMEKTKKSLESHKADVDVKRNVNDNVTQSQSR